MVEDGVRTMERGDAPVKNRSETQSGGGGGGEVGTPARRKNLCGGLDSGREVEPQDLELRAIQLFHSLICP